MLLDRWHEAVALGVVKVKSHGIDLLASWSEEHHIDPARIMHEEYDVISQSRHLASVGRSGLVFNQRYHFSQNRRKTVPDKAVSFGIGVQSIWQGQAFIVQRAVKLKPIEITNVGIVVQALLNDGL